MTSEKKIGSWTGNKISVRPHCYLFPAQLLLPVVSSVVFSSSFVAASPSESDLPDWPVIAGDFPSSVSPVLTEPDSALLASGFSS